MTAPLRLCCWQPLLTAQQSHTYRALKDMPGVDLHAVSSMTDHPTMKGWVTNDEAVLIPEVLSARGWRARIRELIADPQTIHVFGSPFDRSRVTLALVLALLRRRRVFLVSEPYAGAALGYFSDRRAWLTQLKHRARPWLYKVYGLLLARRLTGVFAISPRAVQQFRVMGVTPAHVLPFGYFVAAQPTGGHKPGGATLRCVYVGSLIRRKGVETMLAAWKMSSVLQGRATLDIYGPGDIAAELPTGVALRGRLPYGTAGAVMAAADLVIVPSLADGWAAVVNEAVQAGTPVVVGDAAGAAAMVAEWGCGTVFLSGDAAALVAALEGYVANPVRLAAARAATGPLAEQLEPAVAGRFLYDGIVALTHGDPPPVAPWYPDPGTVGS